MQQQPGRYLCVDTRKEWSDTIEPDTQTTIGKVQYQESTNKSAQPDNLCKLKTSLALDFAKELLASQTITNSLPKRTKTPKKRPNGKLKPLLGNYLTKKADDETSFEVQNGRFSTGNKSDICFDQLSPMFSQSSDIKMFQTPDPDWRQSSLVDSCDVDEFSAVREEKKHISYKEHSTKEVKPCEEVVQRPKFIPAQQFCSRDDGAENNKDSVLYNIEELELEKTHSNDEDFRENENIQKCVENVGNYEKECSRKQRSTFDHVVDEITLATCKGVENSQDPMRNSLFHKSDKKMEDSSASNVFKRTSLPDPDSVHVKDIWYALNTSGYNISRNEISKYKMNSTTAVKSRIKSAPVCRIAPNIGKLPMRTKSAVFTASSPNHSNEDKGDEQNTVEKTRRIKVKIENCPPFQTNFDVVGINKPFSIQPRKIKMQLPLTFKINTRPKQGHFFYFSYGLNMNQKRLEVQLKCKTGVKYWGILFGFRLLFNKKGSTQSDIAFPNVVVDAGFSVEGCVYELPQHCLQLLDNSVGFPEHYARIVASVWLSNCEKPDEYGIAQHCVPSVVYIAQEDFVATDPSLLDSSFTLKQCLLGTDVLTSNYQNYLTSLN